MHTTEAMKIIESLRSGLPPEKHVADFTVGRQEEVNELRTIFLNNEENALLLKSNYGSGKTHLLKLIREMALSNGYAVSLITLDSGSAVRFNRMDQIFGQICRQLEIPNTPGKSVRYLFDAVSSICSNPNRSTKNEDDEDILNLTSQGKWDHSNYLESHALYVALRAWCFADNTTKDLIEDWLFQPWEYKSQRKNLYCSLVENMRRYFNDPRPDWQFYSYKIFDFSDQGYRQSWDSLNDLNKLAQIAGFKGLIILVDEFEDVIQNLRNKKYQQAAFWNLFQFFAGKFHDFAFFAVTPDFAEKCKKVLITKEVFDYDYSRFDELKAFEMSSLTETQMYELSNKIIPVYTAAYNWTVPNDISVNVLFENVDERLRTICKNGMEIPVQDRVRHTIKAIVNALDEMMEESNG